jgi:hypothetical protein
LENSRIQNEGYSNADVGSPKSLPRGNIVHPDIRILEAIENGDLDTFSQLVGQDDSLRNGPNYFGSWLHCASLDGRLPIVKYLVEHGADVNLRGGSTNTTPISLAALGGHLQVVAYLVSHGASLDMSDPGRNPLFEAIIRGHADITKCLLDAGIDANVIFRSETGKLENALSYATWRGEEEIVALLTTAGCRLPIEGVDKPVNEPVTIPDSTSEDKAHEQLIFLMREAFGPVDKLALQEIFPIHPEVHVAINVIRPNEEHEALTLFTTGMSDRAMIVPKGQEDYQYAELLLHLPPNWPHPRDEGFDNAYFWPFEWLRKLAYFPHENETWLGGPMTIVSSADPPVSLGPNTKQTCLLLVANFANWSPIEVEGGKKVRIYTVIPIYTEERDYEIKHGILPLVRRLEERGYGSVVDVNRANVGRE